MKYFFFITFTLLVNVVFAQDTLVPYLKDGVYGYMSSSTKKLVIPPRYHQAETFDGELAYVEIDGEFGFIDKNGNEIIQIGTYTPIFETVPQFNDGLLAVVLEKKYGVINQKGEIIVPFKYDYIGHFSEGKAAVGILQEPTDYNYKVECYKTLTLGWNVNFKRQIPRGSQYNNQKYWWGENGTMRYGFINTKGTVVVPIYYGMVGDYSEGLALVVRNAFHGKAGYINHNGIMEIPAQFVEAYDFENGYAHVKRSNEHSSNFVASNHEQIKMKDSRDGIINKKGQLTIATISKQYFIGQNKHGLLLKSWDNKVCFSSYHGELKIPFGDYKDGIVSKTGPLVLIDENNIHHFYNYDSYTEITTPLKIDELKANIDEVFIFSDINSTKYGVLSKKLSVIIPPKYDVILPFKNGFAKALKSINSKRVTQKFFYIDKEGFEYYYKKVN